METKKKILFWIKQQSYDGPIAARMRAFKLAVLFCWTLESPKNHLIDNVGFFKGFLPVSQSWRIWISLLDLNRKNQKCSPRQILVRIKMMPNVCWMKNFVCLKNPIYSICGMSYWNILSSIGSVSHVVWDMKMTLSSFKANWKINLYDRRLYSTLKAFPLAALDIFFLPFPTSRWQKIQDENSWKTSGKYEHFSAIPNME